jgi:hypothetical protein
MLNLDQVRLLENRVEKAVGKIQSLTAENTQLRSQLSGLQTRVGELEGLVRSFKDDQGRIEEGILNALDRLSAFEDSVFHAETASPAAMVSAPCPGQAGSGSRGAGKRRDRGTGTSGYGNRSGHRYRSGMERDKKRPVFRRSNGYFLTRSITGGKR